MRIALQEMDADNKSIKDLAYLYFNSSDKAEQLLYNYESLKLAVEVPWERRKHAHADLMREIQMSASWEKQYTEALPKLNKRLAEF